MYTELSIYNYEKKMLFFFFIVKNDELKRNVKIFSCYQKNKLLSRDIYFRKNVNGYERIFETSQNSYKKKTVSCEIATIVSYSYCQIRRDSTKEIVLLKSLDFKI